jgi:hypothetical protein
MQASQAFIAIAVLGGILAIIGLIVFLRKHFSPAQSGVDLEPGEKQKVPPAPLQRRAWWGLMITIVTSLLVVVVFLFRDASLYHEDRGTRLLTLGFVVAGILAYAIVVARTRLRKDSNEVVMDERDRMIIARAPAVQLYAVFTALLIWCVALTEAYWDRGAIPVFYPYLMFWTLYGVSIVAWSVGVLVGYRRL